MNKSRYCSFYVSDIHLVTMLLPYINEKMKEKKEFITIFEKDISESAKKVIKSLSLKRKDELKLINVGWKNRINIENIDIENKYIIIMGDDKFIKNINLQLENRCEDFVIMNCFEIFQAEKNIDEIIENHEKLINTKGENDIEKIFTKCTKKNNKKITIIE